MTARSTARLFALPAAVIGFSALAVAPALAHVTISPGEAHAGEYAIATVSVPHGCDGSATTSVTIQVPDEVIEVTPTRNALWDVTKTMTTLDTPIKAEDGDEITEKVGTVVYTAKTPLPDGYRDAFELSFQVPDVAGKTLVFPTIQKCVKGETAWTEVAAEGAAEPEHPAPAIKVLAATQADAPAASDDAASDDDGASKGLAYTGLGVGALGLVTAAAALAKGRKA
jgi:uncharacterized protein YcnI